MNKIKCSENTGNQHQINKVQLKLANADLQKNEVVNKTLKSRVVKAGF